MANPTPYERTYSFTDYQASNPSAPLPGLQVDNELENVETSLGEAIDAINDVRRSDGALKNGIVTVDSLDATVAAGVGAGALASAEAAAASADAASDSAVAAAASATAASGSATAASGYASNALTSRNEASGFSDDSAAAASLSQTARDFANKWATEAEGVDVDDGVNPVGKSAYHWAQVALDAAAGAIDDGAVTTAKLADGALSADATGRAKMADGFVTSAKIASEAVALGNLGADVLATFVRADDAQSFDSTQQAQALTNLGFSTFAQGLKAAADASAMRGLIGIGRRAYDEYSAFSTTTNIIALDDTIPQITEGGQILSASITPQSTASRIRARVNIPFSIATNPAAIVAAIFNGGANAIAAAWRFDAVGSGGVLSLEHEYAPATTSPITFTVRVGVSSGTAGVALNGIGAGRFLGGASKSTLVVEEIVT